MDNKNNSSKNLSRRSFLKGLPLGVLAVAGIGMIGSNLIKSVRRRRPPVFKKNSMFTPKSRQ
ncbi:MAG: twin-arginine translocation signal domain-containing protein [Dehalococcoidia bacterium]